MEKLTVSLIGTGMLLSFNVLALTPDCSIGDYSSGLCAPRILHGLSLGVTGSYVRPSETGLGLLNRSWQYQDEINAFPSKSQPFNPTHDYAWRFQVGYDIPCTATGLEFDYFHLDNDIHSVNAPSDSSVSSTSIFFPGSAFPIGSVSPISISTLVDDAYLKYRIDQADIKIARQFNDVCGRFQIRPAIGIRYGKIRHEFTFNSTATVDVSSAPTFTRYPAQFSGAVTSKFNGTGPLVSLDTRYGFCGGFGIVGRFDGALLVGEMSSNSFIRPSATLITPLSGSPNILDFRYDIPKVDRVVATTSGRIGLDYSVCFCNKSSLTLEVGYEASKYYQASDLQRGDLLVKDFKVRDTFSNDITLRGPYVNITWHA